MFYSIIFSAAPTPPNRCSFKWIYLGCLHQSIYRMMMLLFYKQYIHTCAGLYLLWYLTQRYVRICMNRSILLLGCSQTLGRNTWRPHLPRFHHCWHAIPCPKSEVHITLPMCDPWRWLLLTPPLQCPGASQGPIQRHGYSGTSPTLELIGRRRTPPLSLTNSEHIIG